MLGKKAEKDSVEMAAIAGGRAELYNLLVGVFGHLPDHNLVTKIKSGGFQDALERYRSLDNPRCKSGVEFINGYRSKVQNKSDEEVLNDLSVDRTRILRETGKTGLRPPYEGLYRNDKNVGMSVLRVKTSYRKAGLLPDDSVPESPDYLCIELDFMKNLCRREQSQWSTNDDVGETVAHEKNFLREHIGGWVGEYCTQAEEFVQTDFYRGFLLILDALVCMDREYIGKLARRLKE